MSIFKSIWCWFWTGTRNLIVSNDLYPTPINFTYNGQSSFKTLLGGIVSCFIKLGIVVISVLMTITILQKDNTSVTINTMYKDITNDQTEHYFAKNSDVYFAIVLKGRYPDLIFDKRYVTLNIFQNSYQKGNGIDHALTNSIPIEYELWGNKFPHVSSDLYSRLKLAT